MVVAQGGSEIAVGLVPVLGAAFAPRSLHGCLRSAGRATIVLAWVGLVLAAASTVAPLTGALDVGTGMAIALMHLVAGARWFAALVSSRRR